ncbi:MAG: NAD(P)H-quinone oxidoreductase [Acidobacteria bacterium RIFCSPLOWO2_12_FULL_67_14]|nr:MAG: NAD(P)H-quinone oxidoreductase [Acidobacteria bacterium RIFCSPLOWO2_02_FULL_67_21]OFW35554.1 MAG: NAD(P)H-quinone oxidoreductase [Acidobacteria bacterium RIFCSPLOWO2_12_FULL_67_14]
MQCVEIAEPGGPEVLRLVERPDPRPAAGEVLIAVSAAGINRPDVLQRRGRYPPPEGASDLPGLEVAGTVEAVGAGVTSWRVGDRVCALLSGGGYATKCVAPAAQCLPIPSPLDIVAAAAVPETFFTVWTNVFERGRLQADESFLVHGGTSGIGTTAIQLAAARGARVFATAGSDEKCRACEKLGAARGINYRTEDFAAVVREQTGGRGVDAILDIIGAEYFTRNLESLAHDGRLVVIGLMGKGTSSTVDLGQVLRRWLTITGSTLRSRSVEEKGAIAAALRREVWPLLESGRVAPVVYRTFPLAEAAAAHRLMESGEHIGKIVLTVP